jgi:hypothetical protein
LHRCTTAAVATALLVAAFQRLANRPHTMGLLCTCTPLTLPPTCFGAGVQGLATDCLTVCSSCTGTPPPPAPACVLPPINQSQGWMLASRREAKV